MSIVHTGRFIKNKRGKENEKKNKNHHTIDFTSCGIAVPAVLRRQRTGNTAIRQCAIHCRAIGRRTLFLKNKGSGLYASVDTENTQNIRQQPFTGGNNQIWVIKRSADDGYYNVQNGLLDASCYLAQGLQTTSSRAAASMLSDGAFNVSVSKIQTVPVT